MKKVFCLTFVLLSAFAVFTQEKAIDKAEFEAALKNRFLKYVGRPYRETTTTEDVTTKDDRFKFLSKSVREFAPPNASRLLYESESWLHRKRAETIRIGDKIYTREDGGEWTEKSVADLRKYTPDPNFLTTYESAEYKTLGAQDLNNLKTTVYVQVERRKVLDKSRQAERFWTTVTKYWLDETGGIVREEALSETTSTLEKAAPGAPYRELRTTVWEFDPKIKIESPVIEK